MAERLGADTDPLRRDAFQAYQDHVTMLAGRLGEMPSIPSVVPHPDGEMDETVVGLMEQATAAVTGLVSLMPELTEGDGENVEVFGRYAEAAEDANHHSAGTTFTT